jgi:hypothetical protein
MKEEEEEEGRGKKRDIRNKVVH